MTEKNFHSYACCNINFKKTSGEGFKQVWTILDKFGNVLIPLETILEDFILYINNKDIGDRLCTFLFLYNQQI